MLWSEIDTIVSDLTDADTTDFPTATRIIYANSAQDEVVGDILQADGRWQWDDTNYTNFPISTADLVATQQDYAIADEFLSVERVEILNADGDYELLKPIDRRDVNVAMTEYLATNGKPLEYDKQGRSIFLYPAPASGDVTTTDGLKVYYTRKAKAISGSFGSTSPGFLPSEHMIIPYKIALPYCMKYKTQVVTAYQQAIEMHRKRILEHYSLRSKDEPRTMKPFIENNK